MYMRHRGLRQKFPIYGRGVDKSAVNLYINHEGWNSGMIGSNDGTSTIDQAGRQAGVRSLSDKATTMFPLQKISSSIVQTDIKCRKQAADPPPIVGRELELRLLVLATLVKKIARCVYTPPSGKAMIAAAIGDVSTLSEALEKLRYEPRDTVLLDSIEVLGRYREKFRLGIRHLYKNARLVLSSNEGVLKARVIDDDSELEGGDVELTKEDEGVVGVVTSTGNAIIYLYNIERATRGFKIVVLIFDDISNKYNGLIPNHVVASEVFHAAAHKVLKAADVGLNVRVQTMHNSACECIPSSSVNRRAYDPSQNASTMVFPYAGPPSTFPSGANL
ncbi:uncharacterized protein EV420DRAFT_1753705 [Desarmillaria tabescens]|uniref:Uncharacterized protein n=1 Tax=Armillaria tabescens TaxID=1929756 RepID=A0AA39J7I7_ARMTA|nr:uncharacterized protein EV420DRAFT_1753705 [Desarmillaria tabescens]KAK0436661.1 hypothetical protein EV420DRAFT_1753705 [Desarmillaria tabescens]